MASNVFDQFDAASGQANPFDKFDKTGASPAEIDAVAQKYGTKDTFTVPARPREFVSPEDRPARMVTKQKGTREVPLEGPIDRAIYEAGGRATDIATELGASPETAAKIGFATNLGGQVATSFVGGKGGASFEPAMQGMGRTMMQKALKPTLAEMQSGQGPRAIETMLNEGRLVTKGSVEKMSHDIDLLNDAIQTHIRNSPETVNKFAVAKYAQSAYQRFKDQVNNAKDLDAIRGAVREFISDPKVAENIPVEIAQRLKQGTYRSLGEKAYNKEVGAASVAAQKDLARGLKEEIAAKVPQVRGLNKRESDLINARDIAEAALMRSGNRELVGLGWLAKNPEAYVGKLSEGSPLVKSLLANYLYTHADPALAGAALGAGVGAFEGRSKY